MITKIVTAPVCLPVSLAEAKKHLRVTFDEDDALIRRMISSAVLYCEQYTVRKFITQTWKQYFDVWPTQIIPFFGDLQSVTHIKYTDTDATQSTFSNTLYGVDTNSVPGRVVLNYQQTWPDDDLAPLNPIEVQFVTGYPYNLVIQDAVFDGVGLDDVETGGTYTGTAPALYEVEIQTSATPDTFRWRKNGGTWTSSVAITGAAQTLDLGVTVTFSATTGHTVGEKWEFFAGNSVPEDIRTAIFIMIAHYYENRELYLIGTIGALYPKSVDAHLYNHRIWEWCL